MGRYIAILCLPIVLLGCTAARQQKSATSTHLDDLESTIVEIGDLAPLKTNGTFLHHAGYISAQFTLAKDSSKWAEGRHFFAHLCNATTGQVAVVEEVLPKNREVIEKQESVEFVLSDIFQCPSPTYTGKDPAEYREVLPKGIFFVEIGTQLWMTPGFRLPGPGRSRLCHPYDVERCIKQQREKQVVLAGHRAVFSIYPVMTNAARPASPPPPPTRPRSPSQFPRAVPSAPS